MLNQVIIYLSLAALFCLIAAPAQKYDKFLSFLGALIAFYAFYDIIDAFNLSYNAQFAYEWIRTRNYVVNIDIISSPQNYIFLMPLFFIGAVSALYSAIYHPEQNKLKANSLIILHLVLWVFLVSSQNLIQLIVSATLINILAFYTIDNVASKKNFIFYNLPADLCLFTVFAILRAQTGSLELSSLNNYEQFGHHKDWVAILLLLCLFVKSGLFMFQNVLIGIKDLSFNRQLFISYCSTPLTGVLILFKLGALIHSSAYFLPLLSFFAAASIVWGVWGTLIIDIFKQKILYFNLSLYGLLYGLLSIQVEGFELIFTAVIISGFIINCVFYLTIISSSNEKFVSEIGGFIRRLKTSFIISIFAFFAVIVVLSSFVNAQNVFWLAGFGFLEVLILSDLIRQIYFRKHFIEEKVWARLKNPGFIYFLPLVVFSILSLHYFPSTRIDYLLSLAFLILIIVPPLKFLDNIYHNHKIQSLNLIHGSYDFFIITPIKIFGRFLWLIVDFILIERTLIGSLEKSFNFIVSISKKMNKSTMLQHMFMIVLGLGVLFFYILEGVTW